MSSCRWAGTAIILTLMTLGCVTSSEVHRRGAALDTLLAEQHEAMYHCAPVQLAAAEAELAWARHESSKGRSHTAGRHLTQAEDAAREAFEASRDRKCLGDRDQDTIPNRDDTCPDDPEDFDQHKDTDGCPDPDNDLDGIFDRADRCPNEQGPVSNEGCPVTDQDGDGVPDDRDRCPKEFGAALNQGCPLQDRDKDGILDPEDRCPDDPGTVENAGCPYRRIAIQNDRIVLNEKIFFAFGKSAIKSESFALMNEIAQALKDHPSFRIRIEGHTDNVGAPRSNLRLSQSRANAVRKYLISKGISSKRLRAVGYGQDRPIDDNATEAGRAVNRRVEFFIVSR